MTQEPTETPDDPTRKHRHLVWLGVFAGLVLTAIGVRFLVDPRSAQHTFGLAKSLQGFELHAVIGLRDLWLGLLAVALALFREWRALALWLALGMLVCLADAALVATTTGKPWAVAFHLGSGLVCGWLGIAVWRAWLRPDASADRSAPARPPAPPPDPA